MPTFVRRINKTIKGCIPYTLLPWLITSTSPRSCFRGARTAPLCKMAKEERSSMLLPREVSWQRHLVAHYACRQPKLSLVSNMQDNNGDTALHYAIRAGNLVVFNFLVRNPKVDLNIPNKDDLRPLDLSWSKIPRSVYYESHPTIVMSRTLLLVGAPAGASRSDLFLEKYIGEIDEEKIAEDVAKATQAMVVVSVLIATVTFASAFTLPGGYYQSASDGGVPGTPILAGSYAFNAFIVANALAFICSCLATFGLVFAGLPAMELSLRYKYRSFSAILLYASGRSLLASFAMGLYLVLAPTAHATAITVCVISSGALVFGNMRVWLMLCGLNTARARLGIRGLIATWYDLAPAAVVFTFGFVSLIVIFSLPAIISNLDKTLSSLQAIFWTKGSWEGDIARFILVSLLTVVMGAPFIRLMVQRWKYYKTNGGFSEWLKGISSTLSYIFDF
ncbi:uncharacterized protein LOC120685982 [Panicum virgatum]|uniref:PGG domain-containing protein n=1 Tax=Panicum virgatum TaxID=38727 RepID=A0A8T0PAY3_PANVG|nr:uncharacterized protein LOC120684512 [Panicum virgatum]XP_039822291.1 uncharacterized protein LOC120684512 [Panicum virgatum]XP_039824065.1 uncharacterized protein LOC120685982 [Panicum virgatum]XP_039824066.1 uncharacterized protein LOC120685982 [Panicum virgatum]KAG2558772.1 hypothetical protein PVAP13_8NG342764 [Panicum virgatum]KAG2558780.1 hypothetical protein PVAP13_8NG348800 [Panicum virgatum]